MSSSGIVENQDDSCGLLDGNAATAEKGNSSHESTSILPKALTVSPTDLFPEEQFESSDSEDDAELHAFTQRLDADWRSNLSQALSWSANSPSRVKAAPKADAKGLDRRQHDAAANVSSTDGPRLDEETVEKLCLAVGGQVSLTSAPVVPTTRVQTHAQAAIKSEPQGARPAMKAKPRLKAREAAHVLTARSKQARAARAAARYKHAQGSQESNDGSVRPAAAVAATADPDVTNTAPVPQSTAPGQLVPAVSDLQFDHAQRALVAGFCDHVQPADLSSDNSVPLASTLGAAQHGRPLAKQHRCSSARLASNTSQTPSQVKSSPVGLPAATTDSKGQTPSTSGNVMQTATHTVRSTLQLPTPQPARGHAAVPAPVPGSDAQLQTEFSPPVRGPVFHAGMAQRHPTITTRYRAKRSSETAKSPPVKHTSAATLPSTHQAVIPLQPRTTFSNNVPTPPLLPNQQPNSGPAISARPAQLTGVVPSSQLVPPSPVPQQVGMAPYLVPCGPPVQQYAPAAPNGQPSPSPTTDHKPSPGLSGTGPSKPYPCQTVPVDPGAAAGCAAQLRAAALAQYILSTAPTLMPTVFGHMSADAVAQALPALASASGLLSASMSRPANTAEGTKAADLLGQVKKRYPSLQVPADLVTSARNDTQQARVVLNHVLSLSSRADKRREEDAAGNSSKASKGKKKSAKKVKAKKAPEDVDMQGTMLAVLEELLPGDVMLSLNGSHITFEAVLKPKDCAAGITDEPTIHTKPTNVTSAKATPAPTAVDAKGHPVSMFRPGPFSLFPTGATEGYMTPAINAPTSMYSMGSPVPAAIANDAAALKCIPAPTNEGCFNGLVTPAFGSGPQGSTPSHPAAEYIPMSTRPYGVTIDELLKTWPVHDWCAAPSHADLEDLVSQCRCLTTQCSKCATPTLEEFDLPAEQLVYALAMLANWECAQMFQILTSANVDFRALSLRLPQAGPWFRCQAPATESQMSSMMAEARLSPTRPVSPRYVATSAELVTCEALQDAWQNTSVQNMPQAQDSEQTLAQPTISTHALQDRLQRRLTDREAVKEVFESVLEHLGMSSDLQVTLKDHVAEADSATHASRDRYGQNPVQWPAATAWTRCLGALDCLQVRYMQRPSNEHLLPAFSMASSSARAVTGSVQNSQDYPIASATSVCPVDEGASSERRDAIDAVHSAGMSGLCDDSLVQPSGFVQAGAADAPVQRHRHSEQKQNRSEAADSECSIM
eukprot:jgi/Ulvmu1/10004/UM059_0053.1